jgi:hypothetical protein
VEFRVVAVLCLQLGFVTLPVSTYGSRIWVVVVIDVVIIDLGVIVKFGVGIIREVMGGTSILLSIILDGKIANDERD